MILSYLGIEKDETWLWKQLRAGQITPLFNVQNLATELGLAVEIGSWRDDLTLFASYIELGLPVIIAVDADNADEWPYYKDHAVVVVGYDDQHVFVNDPAQPTGAVEVEMNNFLLAWSSRDYAYAVIRFIEEI